MVEPRLKPPPAPSLPKEAPWTEMKEIVDKLSTLKQSFDLFNTNLLTLARSINPVVNVKVAQAPGAPALAPAIPLIAYTTADYGIVRSATKTTIQDPTKAWEADVYINCILMIVDSGGVVTTATITDNDATTLTFGTLNATPAEGSAYYIKFPKVPSLFTLETPWSATQAQVQLTAVAGDVSLPGVTLSGLNARATVVLALVFFDFRAIENTNALANQLSGAQNIQIRPSGGATWTTCISLVTGLFALAGNAREGGWTLKGNADVSSIITADGAFDLQWTQGLAAQNNLNFDDVQTMLKLWYTM